MALQHLRSSTADKRPTPAAMSDGQLALNTNLASPGLFFKDSNGDSVKIGPVHVGTTAPNATPGAGGQAGNSKGEAWLDTTAANPILKVFNGSAFVAVQPVGTGTVVSTTDTGTVTSTMILDGTILNADINASAAIVDTKLATIATGGKVSGTAITSGNISTSGSFTSTSTVTGTNLIPTGSGVPTNGIYLPAANSVAVATNGTRRLDVNSSGQFRIGDGGAVGIFSAQAAANGNLHIRDIAAVTGSGTGVALDVLNDATSAVQDLAIRGTNTIFRNSAGETLRITSAGLVGIGTSSPSQLLDVVGNSASVKVTETGGADVRITAGGSTGFFGTYSNHPLQILTNSANAVHITAAGNVGIGTTSPGEILEVKKDSPDPFNTVQTHLKLTNGGGNTGAGNRITFATGATQALIQAKVNGGNSNSGTDLEFYTHSTTGTPTTPRMILDTSGRLLVGTSSARTGSIGGNNQIVFEAGSTYLNTILASNGNSSDGNFLSFIKSRGASAGSHTIVQSGDNLGILSFEGADGSVSRAAAQILAQVDGTPGAGDMPGRLVFSTTADGASSPTERMRITSGIDLVGISSPDGSHSLIVYSGTSAGTGLALFIGKYGSSAPYTGGTNSIIIWTNGNVVNTNNSYGALSDIKLKENVVDANSQWDDLKALQVRNYNFKEGQTHTQIGLVAQEVELVSPGLVSESPDRDEEGNNLGTVTKSVNYSVLYMKAVKALQEAMERIEQLEQRLTDAGIA
jgi:hypothetical protein